MAAKNKFKAKRKAKQGQASFAKFESKYETKFENQYKTEFESKPSSSRSSSACSSAGSSASCNLTNNVQLVHEKLNAKSASQSNLSDISSSGFSSASTAELKECNLTDNPTSFNSQFNAKFQSPVGEAHKVRSCSPSSTSSSSSSTKLFIFDKNRLKISSSDPAKFVKQSDVKQKSAIKSDRVNGESAKSVRWLASLPGRSKIDRFLASLSSPVQLLSNARKWAHHHADYLLILTLSVLINLNTLSAGFVYDDNRAIKTNPDVQWSTPIVNLFKNDFWGTPIDQSGSHKSYRPLCTLTFKLNHYFHEFNASGYHLVNLVIHCLVCLLFTSLAKRWTHGSDSKDTCNSTIGNSTCNKICNQICNQKRNQNSNQNCNRNCNQTHNQVHSGVHNLGRNQAYRSTDQPYWQEHDRTYRPTKGNRLSDQNGASNELREAPGNRSLNAFNLIKQLDVPPIYLIASLLFCVHPIHTEAVAGLVGRADIGCSLFVLLSLYFYDNYLRCIYQDSTANSFENSATNSNANSKANSKENSNANSNGNTNASENKTSDFKRNSPNQLRNLKQANFQPLSDLNGRGRAEFKERRLMQLPVYLDAATNGSSPVNERTVQPKGLPNRSSELHGNLPENYQVNGYHVNGHQVNGNQAHGHKVNGRPPTNLPSDRTPSNRWSARLQLYLAIVCAIISVAWKEYGVTVFAICALYHLIVNCGRLACSTGRCLTDRLDQSKRLVSPNLLRRRRCQTDRSKAAEQSIQREDKLSTRPPSKEPSEWRTFVRCLHAILNHPTFASVRSGWLHLAVALIVTLAVRFWIMGELKMPRFSPADNPTAAQECALTRTLTFLYLVVFNFWLLLCPTTLSYDWSMQSIPLVTEIHDVRNLATLAFFAGLVGLVIRLINHYARLVDLHLSEEQSSIFESSPPASSSNASPGTSPQITKNDLDDEPLQENYESSHSSESSFDYYRVTMSQSGHRPSQDGHRSSSDQRSGCSFINHLQTNKHNFTTADICSISIILLVLPFLPATNLISYVGFVVAERCLYMPSFGFCLLIALAIHQARQQLAARLTARLMTASRTSLGLLRKQRKRATNHRNNFDDENDFGNEPVDLKRSKKTTNVDQRTNLAFNLFLGVLLICFTGRTWLRNFDWADEETLYRSGVHVNAPKSLGNLASILSRNGLKQEAEQAYRKALSYRWNSADVHYNLGILLQEQKRYDEALESYENAIKFRPRLAAAYLNMGYVYNLLNRKEKAIEMYQLCASIDGEGLKDPRTHQQSRISALLNLGKLYADQGEHRRALDAYEQALSKEGIQIYYQIHSLYTLIGESHSQLGEDEQAEASYLKAFHLKQDHLPLHLAYAKFLQKRKRPDEAEQWFMNARLLAPKDSSILLHFGQFLCDLNQYERAADIYSEAVDSLPTSFELAFNYANVLRLAKRFEQAERYYKLAVDLKPNDLSARLNCGAILHLNGKLTEAERHYLVALELNPNDAIARSNLEKLRNLKNDPRSMKSNTLNG